MNERGLAPIFIVVLVFLVVFGALWVGGALVDELHRVGWFN